MNPGFRWFVGEISKLDRPILVRSNLTILTATGPYRRLPQFFADHAVTVISSLEHEELSPASVVRDREVDGKRRIEIRKDLLHIPSWFL